jgi:glycosyltransferase involved in cell wall biosynthesis
MSNLLSIGIPTYKDYDGVYFTIQSLRMFHNLNNTEILVIDTEEKENEDVRDLCRLANVKYYHKPDAAHTPSAAKNYVFQCATGQYVMCIDCHIMLEKHSLQLLKNYLKEKKPTKDLLQGPLLYDDLTSLFPAMKPTWVNHFFGSWAYDDRAKEDKPFEIKMQGMGLFCMSKKHWVGFNKSFSGFGGEEFYLHEKVRQHGGKTLCLPFLKWLHRFKRPNGVPYKLDIVDRIANYLIGWSELKIDTKQIIDHYRPLVYPHELKTALDRFKKYKNSKNKK